MGYFSYGPEVLGTAGRIYTVSADPRDFQTVQDAIDAAINEGLGASDRAQVLIKPGLYTTTAPITVPGYLTILGSSRGAVQLENDTTDLFQIQGPNTWFENFTVEGGANASTYAFDCNNQNAVHVRRVDLLNNGGTARQKFLKQIGATWSVLFIEDCVVDYYGLTGFHTLVDNTGPAARFVDAIINNVFFDAFQLTGAGGNIDVQGCQDVRIRNSTLRGNQNCTGIQLSVSGVTGVPTVKVNHTWIGASPGVTNGTPILTGVGTSIELYNVYYSRFDAALDGNTIEDATVDQFGIGSWRDVGGTANAGDMNPNSATISATTQIVFNQDDVNGRRVRAMMGNLRDGDSVMFVPLSQGGDGSVGPVPSATFTVGSVAVGGSTFTLNGMIVSNFTPTTTPNWADFERWGMEVIPNTAKSVLGPTSATDNRIARYNGATGKLIQDSVIGISDTGIMTNVGTDALMVLAERTGADPTHSPGFGKIWVDNTNPTTLVFTDDVSSDRPIMTAPVAAVGDNRIVRWDGTSGHTAQNSPIAISDNGAITMTGNDNKLEMVEKSTAPAGSTGYGKIWIKNDAPTRAAYTDDDGGDFYLDRQDKTIMARLDMGQTTNTWTTWLEYGPYAPSVWNSPVGGTTTTPSHSTAWAHSGIWFPREAKLWSIEIMLYLSGATTYNYDLYLRGSIISNDQTAVGSLNTHGSIIGSSYAGSAKRVLHTMTITDDQILAGECLLFWHRRTTATSVSDDPEAMVRIEYSEVV